MKKKQDHATDEKLILNYVLVIARFGVHHHQNFPSFLYFANLFHKA